MGQTINVEIQYPFLAGGGEMGRLTREKNWDQTVIGGPGSWPQSLRTTLSIILNSNFPMFLFWGPKLICFYNDAYRPSLGKEGKHPDILGQPGEEAWPEIWDIIKPLIDQVLSEGKATWSEDQMIPIYRNGKIEDVYWTFSYSPVNDESGKTAGVFVTCVETTDKVLTMNQVEDSLDLLEFAIEATELGTWDLDPVTNKFTANHRLKQWLGIDSDSQTDLMDAMDLLSENDRARAINDLQSAMDYASGGQIDTIVTIIDPQTKQERVVRSKGRAWFNDDKEAYRLNGTLQDITTQHNAAKEQQKLITLIEASQEFIGLADTDSNFQYVNPSGLKLLGWESYEGKTIKDCIFEKDQEKAQELISKLDHFSSEIRFVNNQTQETYWIQWNGIAIKDETSHEVIGLAMVSPNITEHKITEKKLKKALVNMEEQHQQKDLFIGMASHELNTPITSIKGYVQILQSIYKDGGDDSLVNALDIIDKQILTLTSLIQDLLDVSKIKSGSLELQKEQFDISRLVWKIINEIRIVNPEHEINYTDGQELMVNADKERIGQVLINFLTNAVKYSPSSKRIDVRCFVDKQKVKVLVKDYGIGIRKDNQEKIFERFFRVEGNENTFPGFGIGLFIASEIIKGHGGKIGVKSKPGNGAEFYFSLNQQGPVK